MSYMKIFEPNYARVLPYLTTRDPNNKQKKNYTTVARYQVHGEEVNVLASRNQKSVAPVAGSSINLFRTL